MSTATNVRRILETRFDDFMSQHDMSGWELITTVPGAVLLNCGRWNISVIIDKTGFLTLEIPMPWIFPPQTITSHTEAVAHGEMIITRLQRGLTVLKELIGDFKTALTAKLQPLAPDLSIEVGIRWDNKKLRRASESPGIVASFRISPWTDQVVAQTFQHCLEFCRKWDLR